MKEIKKNYRKKKSNQGTIEQAKEYYENNKENTKKTVLTQKK